MSQLTRAVTNSGPGGFVQTLTSNVGGPVPPTAGNINVIGGVGITGTGNPGTSTITLDLTGSVATQYTEDVGSATPAANNLNVLGGNNIQTTGAGSTITIDLNGTTDHAIQIGNATGSLTSLAVSGDGQLPIGSVGADPVIANLTPGAGVTIANAPGSITISASSSTALTYTEDVGIAIPVANNLNIVGTHGINTLGAGDTVTIAVNNTLTLGDLVPVVGDTLTLTTGNANIVAGNLLLPDTNTGGTAGEIKFGTNTVIQNYPTASSNFVAGFLAGNTAVTLTGQGNNGIGGGVFSQLTSGASNAALGHVALQVVNTGSQNTAIGAGALNQLTSGANNSALGYQVAQFLATGGNNVLIGTSAGSSYVGAESNNIIISNSGVAAENAKIRIGTNATHTGTYIAGIDGVNVGSTAKVVTLGAGGTVDQLGTATITAGSGITVTPGANTITISSTGADILAYTNVTTTPYVVLTTDEYLSVDTSALSITVQLPNAATLGRVYYVKDRTGTAGTRNITVTTVGGAVNIDGATSFVMNTNYQSVNIIGNGTTYEVF